MKMSQLIMMCSLALFTMTTVPPAYSKPLPVTKPENVGMLSKRLALLDGAIQKSIDNKEVPGVVVLVAHKGKVVYKKAFGNRMVTPRVEKMTVDTIFDLASVTKPTATATGIMKLVEDGKIRLYDRVSTFIPEFAQNGKKDVNLLHLITHSSGLPGWDRYFLKEIEHDGIIKDICSKSTTYEPGTKFVYSDLGFITLGEVITRASGKPENEFVAEQIFQPLGMIDTGYLPPKEKWSRCIATEARNGVMLQGQVHDGNAWKMGGVSGHAGLFSTVDDMAIYCQMMLNDGEYNGVRILSPMTVRAMTTNQSLVDDDFRGYGWILLTSNSGQKGDMFPKGIGWGHIGWTGPSVFVDPSSQTTILLFCNRNHPDNSGDGGRLRSIVSNIVASAMVK